MIGSVQVALALIVLALGCVLLGLVGAIVTVIRYRIHNRNQLGNRNATHH